MLQGDPDWLRLTQAIAGEDAAAQSYGGESSDEERLHGTVMPVPFLGAVMTAPVVLLLTHPLLDARSVASDYAFNRAGWPLSLLHPEAPVGLAERWHDRLDQLVDAFGAQHVSNAVAAVFLSPWPGETFEARSRLPSRHRQLDLAARAAARDALILVLRGDDLWTEHPEIAALPPTRRFYPKTWRTTRLSRANLGEDAWTTVCKRVEVHAWL